MNFSLILLKEVSSETFSLNSIEFKSLFASIWPYELQ